MSCPQIWNIEEEKDRKKEKIGDRPANLHEKKGDGELERDIRNYFLFEEQNEFVTAVNKIEQDQRFLFYLGCRFVYLE